MELIDFKSIYILFHIFGAVLGAGGAYVSDAIFFSSVKDKVINHTEFRFMKLGSLFVWTGLFILFVSGLLLFLTNIEGYLASSKFLIKMFIVFVIFLNGIFFHMFHFPKIYRHINHHYPSSDEFMRNKKLLMISGVISITSWTFALILGSVKSIPLDFTVLFLMYIIFEMCSILITLKFFNKIF